MLRLLLKHLKKSLTLMAVLLLIVCVLSLRTLLTTQDNNIPTYNSLQEELGSQFYVLFVTPASPPEKVKHIAFLKVHKSASTTAQNIFLRFGWTNDLTFVLPPKVNKFGYPNIISLRESLNENNTLPHPLGKEFDILCNHVIYNRKAFESYLPEDTVYIGILREPYDHFKSILNYVRPRYIFAKIKRKRPSSVYLQNPREYEPKQPVWSFTNNRMSVEFGLPEEVIKENNLTMALQYINRLEQDFGLVIIAEMFEESIVLMRRYLKWTTKDILYVDKNIAVNKNISDLVGPFDRQLYKRWAKVDYILYNTFYRRLREQIRVEGSDFDDELLSFREIRRMTNEFCKGIKGTKEANSSLVVEKSNWSDAFYVTAYDCDLMAKGEIAFMEVIRIKQYGH